ncbi:carboxylesterase family protein [Pseudonocardia oceani]|uniref:carboxylesterase family protein n=1 Tax=Pseudonocardia oceani TaxID=2792013 RepID=UPI00226B603A|nr:carboxylesterase family protein [Pseudonocardia oceani]
MDYRLGLTAGWPGTGVDVKRALAWVHAHIADHGGDPAFVAISGGSADGHPASPAAVTAGDPALQPGFEDADTSVVAAVPVYGVHAFSVDEHGLHGTVERAITGTRFADDTERRLSASPLHRFLSAVHARRPVAERSAAR